MGIIKRSDMKKIFSILVVCIVAGGIVFGIATSRRIPPAQTGTGTPSSPLQQISQAVTQEAAVVHNDIAAAVPARSSATIALTPAVPFTVQAPDGNWSNPLFQNGCEEASLVMAMAWVNGTSLDTQSATNGIKNISAYEVQTFGYAVDASVSDVAKIVQGYYHYNNVAVKENITADDIRSELSQNHVVLVPAFGQELGNPNYTAPGPITHMLVVIGWDQHSGQFITNDPGTRHGAGYRYSQASLMNAIWEYPSGATHPATPASGTQKKAMVVIWRNQ